MFASNEILTQQASSFFRPSAQDEIQVKGIKDRPHSSRQGPPSTMASFPQWLGIQNQRQTPGPRRGSGQGPRRGLEQGSDELPQRQRGVVVSFQPEDVDPQLRSPLYDGTIPADVRRQIFEYATAEYVDPRSHYPTNTDYTRPGFLGKKKVSINVLLLCKRSYLETRHLPPVKKTHSFWHGRGPADCADEGRYFSRLKPDLRMLVKEVHLFTQQIWLEGSFPGLCRLGVFAGVERMKITLRRGDWWWNERNAPLAITPERLGADVRAMKDGWRNEDANPAVAWDQNSWGSAFRFVEGLKELEMEFETYDYKQKELDEIVQHAGKWRFPLGDGIVLRCDGGVKMSTWRGPPCGWFQCPKCGGRSEDCRFCEEMRALRMEGKGPMLIVRSLTWKLAQSSTRMAF